MALEVLYEDNHLLAVLKPPGVATMGAQAGRETLLDRAKEYVARRYNKPGNVYLGVVSRLDAPVSGVVLFARTSKAAARLSEAFRERRVDKKYVALVEGAVSPAVQTLKHYLRKDERRRRMHVTTASAQGASLAELSLEVLAVFEDRSLVLVRPATGRKHQIRVQLAKIGAPIVGDAKYGAREAFPRGVALHAWRLELDHPVRGERVRLQAPPPSHWPAPARNLVAARGDA